MRVDSSDLRGMDVFREYGFDDARDAGLVIVTAVTNLGAAVRELEAATNYLDQGNDAKAESWRLITTMGRERAQTSLATLGQCVDRFIAWDQGATPTTPKP